MTCQTSQNIEALKTELHLMIKDENGELLTGAVVSVFNNETTYLEKSPSYSTEGAVEVDTSINGVSVITKLNSKDKYRISVHYKDDETYPGATIDYDNSTQDNTIPVMLDAGSISNAQILLKPANGLVVFWTEPENYEKIPFKVALSNSVTDWVTKSFTKAPEVSQDSVTVINVKTGFYNYAVSSEKGCIYADTISVKAAALKYVKLQGCNTGRISFWASTSLNSSLPITLVINNNDTLGVINSVFTTAPKKCDQSNLLFGDYPPGKYNYTAISSSSNSVWAGKLDIVKDGCNLIEIK